MGRAYRLDQAEMTAIAWVLGIGIGLVLLFRYPRQMGLTVLGLLGLGAAIWGYFAYQQAATDRLRSQITASALADLKICSDVRFPVLVTFRNDTGKVVTYISFSLQGHMPGHSTNVVDSYLTTDVILQPGAFTQNCWLPDTYGKGVDFWALEWAVSISTVTSH